MCGVFGVNSNSPVVNRLLEGLFRLEYRGYDSAGVAFIDKSKIFNIKVKGKVSNLAKKLKSSGNDGNIGIAHTRWATHGVASERNAHPHSTDEIAIVHNGIIENDQELHSELVDDGIEFSSDTDSELILHLVEKYFCKSNYKEAVRKATSRLQGSFSILIIFKNNSDIMVASKKSLPLAIGCGNGENFISSDAGSLSVFTENIIYLSDGDIALIYKNKIEVFDKNSTLVHRDVLKIKSQASDYSKGQYSHYMQKEIYEQPLASKSALERYISREDFSIKISDLDMSSITRIFIIACGSSYFAGMIARYWFEEVANIPVTIEVASELISSNLIIDKNSLAVFISQSGETADTIAALEKIKDIGIKTLAIVNVEESTIAHKSDYVLPIYAGQEIGVASTKAFINQLIVLACFATYTAISQNKLSKEGSRLYISALLEIPGRIAEILGHDFEYKKISELFMKSQSILFIGRRSSYAVALEGALKLKEISYIHAEAVMAGELKHGSIALIDENMYTIAIIPEDALFNKVAANIKSIKSRGGKVLALSSNKGCNMLNDKCSAVIPITNAHDIITPIIYIIPLQLIAYHAGVLKGHNVDQPRNLAKSVTVE